MVSLANISLASFKTDSELLAKQVKGAFKVKNPVLQKLLPIV
jgi:hypothetical protein